jgi:hypothetical protein
MNVIKVFLTSIYTATIGHYGLQSMHILWHVDRLLQGEGWLGASLLTQPTPN